MSKEAIIKIIDMIDVELEKNKQFGVYIPTTKMLMDNRDAWADMLYRLYGIIY